MHLTFTPKRTLMAIATLCLSSLALAQNPVLVKGLRHLP